MEATSDYLNRAFMAASSGVTISCDDSGRYWLGFDGLQLVGYENRRDCLAAYRRQVEEVLYPTRRYMP